MSSFLYRLGRAAARGRLLVIVGWVLVLALSGAGAALLSQGTDDTFTIPGSESQDTLDYLGRVFPEVGGTQAQLVVVVPDGQRADRPDVRAAVKDAVPELRDIDQVSDAVRDPFGKDVRDAVSEDGRAINLIVPLEVDKAEVSDQTKDALLDAGDDLAQRIGDGARSYVGGDAMSDPVPKLSVTEAFGVIVALVVLLIVFKSLIAAGMPLLTAIWGVGISVALIFGATVLTPVSSTAPMLAVMLGLAVGIDYALFILSRHRDQLAEGLDVEESIARAVATAGSAVIFAGMTVMIALLGLAVAGIPFLTTMGIAAAFGVAVAVAVAVTVVPALLRFAGERLRPRPPKPKKRSQRRPRVQREGKQRTTFSQKWVRVATKAPILTVAVIVVGLGVCAIPAGELRLALPNNGTEEEGSPARDTYDVVSEHFGSGYNGPLLVTADIIGTTDPIGVVDDIAEEIRKVDNVASVPLATPNPKGDTGIIQVTPDAAPDSAETEQLVSDLRGLEGHFEDEYGAETNVTGFTAVGIDVSSKLGQALVPFGLIVVGLSLVLLAMVFRSIWVPIKAAAGYLLSVGAAFGATVFVFQEGHFADVLGVSSTGNVISFLPIILMGVLFGLAMDYEVFLVSRIREDFVHRGDPKHAIETGFVSASRVVIAAAVIMFAVFAAFVPEGNATIKPIAFGLAVGVFIDAFVVRMTLVPAVLALLGKHAWGLPPWLDRRLPVFDAEGDGLVHELKLREWPAPNSPEVISAAGLRLGDDRDRDVYAGVDIHLMPGGVLALSGSGGCGKSALLLSLAGRVGRLDGDLKVLGHVVPNHSHAVRRDVALIPCREVNDPAWLAQEAVRDGVALILLDDLDTVVNTEQRDRLRDLIADASLPDGTPVSWAFTCQNPSLLNDMISPSRLTNLSLLSSTPVEV